MACGANVCVVGPKHVVDNDIWQIAFSICALLGSTAVSFSAITSLQNSVRRTEMLYRRLNGKRDWRRQLKDLRDFYDALEVRPDLTENNTQYPCQRTDPRGMKIAFR
jgi:hypothetical protein